MNSVSLLCSGKQSFFYKNEPTKVAKTAESLQFTVNITIATYNTLGYYVGTA